MKNRKQRWLYISVMVSLCICLIAGMGLPSLAANEGVLPDAENKDYVNNEPKWAADVPANGVKADPQSPEDAYGMYTYMLTPEADGSFGVALNIAPDGTYQAIYTKGGSADYILRTADGAERTLAANEDGFDGTQALKIELYHSGNNYGFYINGREIAAGYDETLSAQPGRMGLYNPGSGAGKISSNSFRKLIHYENDFSDSANLGSWTHAACSQTADGKLKLHVEPFKNNGVLAGRTMMQDSPCIQDGIYEFDYQYQSGSKGRIGFFFRTNVDNVNRHQSIDIDFNNGMIWSQINQSGGVAKLPVGTMVEIGKPYHFRITLSGKNLKIEMDNKQIYNGVSAAPFDLMPGYFGIEKWYVPADIYLDNLKISEIANIEKEEDKPVQIDPTKTYVIGQDLKAAVFENYPGVSHYELDGKTLPGNHSLQTGVELNSTLYIPRVTSKKINANTVRYTLKFADIGVTLKLDYTVSGRNLQMRLTDVQETKAFKVETLRFYGDIVSTDSADPAATHASVATNGGWKSIADDIYENLNTAVPGMYGRGYAMLSSSGLAATVNNSGITSDCRLFSAFYRDQNQKTTGAIDDGVLTYRTPLDIQDGTHHDVWTTVAVCGDVNNTGDVNWQDAAVNYRTIRTEIKGMDIMKDYMLYIASNGMSRAYQPFLRVMDLSKTMYNYTDGFGQMIMHKGYQAEGHDDSHGDYGDHFGIRFGGLEDFQYIIEEGKKYNVLHGIHINVSEHHLDSYFYNNDVMFHPLSKNWNWGDQAYFVNEAADILSGNRKQNFERLHANVPDLAFVYCDIYNKSNWMTDDLIKTINGIGCMAATEFGGPMELGTAFTHWGNDRHYPLEGNNSKILRFIKGDLNVFVPSDLFNTAFMPRIASWGGHNVSEGPYTFNTNVLPAKYLQHYPLLELGSDYARFENGVMTRRTADGFVELTHNGRLIAKWQSVAQNATKYYQAATDTGDAITFLPWYGPDSVNKDPNEAYKIYHWNAFGTDSTWTVPEGWSGNIKVYKLERDQKILVDTVAIVDGKISLHVEQQRGYVLYPEAVDPLPAADSFGAGSGMKNRGFEDRTLKGWTVEGEAKAEAITLSNWEPILQITGKGSAVLSQTITDLKDGQDTILYFYTTVGKTGRVTAEVTTASGTYTAEALPTMLPCGSIDKFGGDFQRCRVVFHVPEGEHTAQLKITGTPNDSQILLDDVTIFDFTTGHVPQAGKDELKDYLYYEDFENVETDGGTISWVYGNWGRYHLAERSDVYKQYKDYVLNGNFSLKSSNNWKGTGQTVRTITDITLEPDTEYTFGFTYETGVANIYKMRLNNADGTILKEMLLEPTTLNAEGRTVTCTFRNGPEKRDVYISLEVLASPPNAPYAGIGPQPEGSAFEYSYCSLDDLYIKVSDQELASRNPEAVMKLISEIGEVTLEDAEIIPYARHLYNMLSAEEQAMVENEPVLTEAEAALKELQTEKQHRLSALQSAIEAAEALDLNSRTTQTSLVLQRELAEAKTVFENAQNAPVMPDEVAMNAKAQTLSKAVEAFQAASAPCVSMQLSRTNMTAASNSEWEPDKMPGGGDARNAIDGNRDSFWHNLGGDPGPYWIQVTFPAPVTLSGMEYLPRVDHENGRWDNFTMYILDKDKKEIPVLENCPVQDPLAVTIHTFTIEPVEAYGVKIVVNSAYANLASAAELNFLTPKSKENIVKMVEDKISAIGEVTWARRAAIEDASAAYEALTAEQKEMVSNRAVLADAVSKLDAMKAAQEQKVGTLRQAVRTAEQMDVSGKSTQIINHMTNTLYAAQKILQDADTAGPDALDQTEVDSAAENLQKVIEQAEKAGAPGKSVLLDRTTMTAASNSEWEPDKMPGGGDARNAIDGNRNSFWHNLGANSLPCWIQVTFPAPVTLSGMEYLPRVDHPNGHWGAFTMYILDKDGKEIPVLENCPVQDPHALTFHTFTIEPVEAYGVKIVVNAAYANVASAAELNFLTPEAPQVVEIANVGQSLSLEDQIYINNYVTITGADDIDLTRDAGMLIWTEQIDEEDALMGSETAVNRVGLKQSKLGYGQQTDGIAAAEYADSLYMRIYVKNTDGSYAYGPLVRYSVRDYCEKVIASEKTSQSLKNTCIQMLHFGAAAQTYFGYHTEDPANKNIAEAYPGTAWDAQLLTPLAPADTALKGTGDVLGKGRSLSLEDRIVLNYYFAPDGYTAERAELMIWKGVEGALTEENSTETVQMTALRDGRYAAQGCGIAAAEYGKTVYVRAKLTEADGREHYSEVVAFSPEFYASQVIAQNRDPALTQAVKAMVLYGEAARIHFGK